MTLRTTGIAALLVSIIAGLTSILLFAAAYQFRADQEPTHLLAAGTTPAELLRWGAVLDLFGYYLPTAVLAYVLWRQLRPRNPLFADLSTMAAGRLNCGSASLSASSAVRSVAPRPS